VRYVLPFGMAAGLFASPALAASGEETLAQCAWERVPATSQTLLSVAKLDKQYVYDADGSPTVGPLMRIWAACHEEKKAAYAASRAEVDHRKFLKKLRSAKPGTIAADQFSEPVFQCKTWFSGDAEATDPAAVGWGFGDDLGQHQLHYKATIFGVAMTDADRKAVAGDDVKAMFALFERAKKEADQAVQVDTREEGAASKTAYSVKDGGGVRRCRLIHSDGSYSNA